MPDRAELTVDLRNPDGAHLAAAERDLAAIGAATLERH